MPLQGPTEAENPLFYKLFLECSPPLKGKLFTKRMKKIVPADKIYKYISLAAPYLELVEEMTLSELIHFHLQFKNFKPLISVNEFIETIKLTRAKHKTISFFSSGMKQRLKLALAFLLRLPNSIIGRTNFQP